MGRSQNDECLTQQKLGSIQGRGSHLLALPRPLVRLLHVGSLLISFIQTHSHGCTMPEGPVVGMERVERASGVVEGG